jgi:hypothetical protein
MQQGDIHVLREHPSNGHTEEQWIINPLENKLGNEQNWTSAAANSEILFP